MPLTVARRPRTSSSVLLSCLNHPTLPSSLRPSSLVASTANSIGNCWNTVLQNPLMIIDTASSVPMPRCAK